MPLPPPRREREHAAKLLHELAEVDREAPTLEHGFDPRLLLKLTVTGMNPGDLRAYPGFELVSQERNDVVLLFVNETALQEFRRRIQRFGAGNSESADRKSLIQAIDAIDLWRAEDRLGPAIRAEGWPTGAKIDLDVELWPLEQGRIKLVRAFEKWCKDKKVAILGRLENSVVVLFRCRGSVPALTGLLQHPDVRRIDHPPQWDLDVHAFRVRDEELERSAPPPTAATVGVLDSGIVHGHPLLQAAVVRADSYLEGRDASDDTGHGTAVAGCVVYGDIEQALKSRHFKPLAKVASARVLSVNSHSVYRVEEIVSDLVQRASVRVFNLSLRNKKAVYRDGHPGWLAATLDDLSRKHNVLFIVCTGNRDDRRTSTETRDGYPRRLLEPAGRLEDPGPGLNVITVGAIARHDRSSTARTYPSDPRYHPLARRDQPSPFTRSGPGACGSIKPDLVEYGGNQALNLATDFEEVDALGELCLNFGFAFGSPFIKMNGSSHAAPKVAHIAARLLERYPNASPNLLRALLVASARTPDACMQLDLAPEERRRLVGYGKPDADRALDSVDTRTVLMCEEEIEADRTHFYEIPLPTSFLSSGNRPRRIVVAVAHTPHVRSTRLEYRASSLRFRLMKRQSLDEVVSAMTHGAEDKMPKELGNASTGADDRSRGSVQCSSFEIQVVSEALRGGTQKVFLTVTRKVAPWGTDLVDDKEKYAVVVALEDEDNAKAELYTELSVMLRARARVQR